ncbi:MAG: glycoside hydrolase family 99-like domain-containing protein [Draconibacterium sp.]
MKWITKQIFRVLMVALLFATTVSYSYTQEVTLGAYYFDGWSGLTQFPHITESLKNDFKDREPIWGWKTSSEEIMKEQIDVAADAGIDFFSFCWYCSKDPKISIPLNRALGFYLESENNKRLQFNVMVANHGVQFAIGPNNWLEVTATWIELMKHPQYLKTNGKPIITFFLIPSLIENFGSVKATKIALEEFRNEARKAGVGELAIASCIEKQTEIEIAKGIGIDILTAYNNHECGVDGDKEEIPMSRLIEGQEKIWNSYIQSEIPYMPAITLNWDPRPWKETKEKKSNFRMYYYVPYNTETVREVVSRAINWVANHPDSTTPEKILTMYAWNELGEGGWLTPSKIGGDFLLKGVTEALNEK